MEKKLHRDEHRKVIGGVCAGLAEYFDIDVSIVRLVFLLALILKGSGGGIYIILWIVLPKKGYLPPVDYTVPPVTGAPYQSANPFQQAAPVFVPVKKQPTTATLIGGLVMILLGLGFLLDQFDIIPDWSFEQWWPVILIVIGVVLIFSRNKHTAPPAWKTAEEPPVITDEDKPTDNPQTGL